jgi:uncharacterized iron-regulated membrane protein
MYLALYRRDITLLSVRPKTRAGETTRDVHAVTGVLVIDWIFRCH